MSKPPRTDLPAPRGLHAIALVTAIATFPLITLGGLVTSNQAGLSVPNWPNSFGYNMFLFPPRLWVGGIFYEHTHRLMGTVVGMLAIVLACWAWRIELANFSFKILGNPKRFAPAYPRLVRWLCLSVLLAVIVQGVLGGLHVDLISLTLAIVHGCAAQAVFCLMALTVVLTSRWWASAPDLSRIVASGNRLIVIALIVLILVFGQLIVGAVMRHHQAGLAVTDFPLIYGKWMPPTTKEGLKAINRQRMAADFGPDVEPSAWQQLITPVTLGQLWIHYTHRLGAIAVSVAVLVLIWEILRRHRQQFGLVWPAVLLLALLMTQVTLGAVTVLWRKPADIATAHVAVGALLLVTTFVINLRAIRLYSQRASLPAAREKSSADLASGLRAATVSPS